MGCRAAVVGVWLALVLSLVGAPGRADDEPAPYPGTTALTIPRLSAIEADPAHDRAFVAGGGNTEAIDVVASSGELEGSIPLRHADDLLLSPDGTTMYVSVRREPARIDAIDLDTLEVSTVALIENGDPDLEAGQLAWAAGTLWVVASPNGIKNVAVSVDPQSGDTAFFDLPVFQPSITGSPGRPDTLVVGASDELHRYRVTGGETPSFELEQSRRLVAADIDEVTLSPDGSRIVVVEHAYRGPQVYRTRDLASIDSYNVQSDTNAVAFGPDGQVAVSHRGVSVFGAGHTSFAARYAVPPGNAPSGDVTTTRNGLAWGDDELYSVLAGPYDGNVRIAVLPGDTPAGGPPADEVQGTAFHRVLAVPGRGRAFLTQGRDGNGVFVLDRSGRVTEVVEHLPGATEMTLDRDGSTLYVALSRADSIAVIDTRTLAVRRIFTGTDSCPESLALTGRRLWFAGTCYLLSSGPMGAVDLGSGTLHSRLGRDAYGTYLTSSPMHPDTVWAATPAGPSGDLRRLTVTTRGRAVVKQREVVDVGPSQVDQALTPDGLHLLPATPGTPFHPVLDPRKLTLVGAAPTQFNPLGVAVRSDGLFAAGVGDADLPGWLNEPTQSWAVRVFSTALGPLLGSPRGLRLPRGAWISPRGVAFGDRDLYTVHDVDGDLRIDVQQMPSLRPVTLTADQAGYRRGERARLVAHVTPSSGDVVAVHRRTPRGPVLVERGRTDRFGNLATEVKVRPGQRYVATLQRDSREWKSGLGVSRVDRVD